MHETNCTKPSQAIVLRRRAETILDTDPTADGRQIDPEVRALIHELTVHQIELQMQNEELRAAQLELLESKGKYTDLYEFAPVGYFTLTDRGTIEEMNLTGASLLGKPLCEIQGQPFSRFVASVSQDTYHLFMQRVREQQALHACNLELTNAEGTFTASIEGRAVERNGELFGGVRLCVADITERTRLMSEIAKLDKLEAVGRLAGGIAHDFNNLLTGIAGNVAVLRMESAPDNDLQDCLNDIQAALERATKLTDQLLTFAAGGKPVRAVMDIGTLIHDTVRFSLTGSNSRCEFQLFPKPIHVNADAGQISQVIGNLCLNAAQAQPDGGTIAVETQEVEFGIAEHAVLPAGKYVKVSVQDRGTGISAENLERMFDLFFTTKPAGRGLGLATAHSIVRNHGGHIECTSEPSKGATVTFYLPVTSETVPGESPVTDGDVTRGSGRILVMDDEALVRNALERLLTLLGYEVEVTSEGSEAIDAFVQARISGRPFDAVLLDLTIPGGMGGKDAARELRLIDPGARLLICSGYSADRTLRDYREHGFCHVIKKPFTIQALGNAVAQALQPDFA